MDAKARLANEEVTMDMLDLFLFDNHFNPASFELVYECDYAPEDENAIADSQHITLHQLLMEYSTSASEADRHYGSDKFVSQITIGLRDASP
jgi:hypothetical protein